MRWDDDALALACRMPSLLCIARCPVGCGMSDVVALKSASGRLVFFAPCCGLAWPEDAEIDLDTMQGLDAAEAPFVAANEEEVLAAPRNRRVLGSARIEDWRLDIPGLVERE